MMCAKGECKICMCVNTTHYQFLQQCQRDPIWCSVYEYREWVITYVNGYVNIYSIYIICIQLYNLNVGVPVGNL